jgi:hypothetical protein
MKIIVKEVQGVGMTYRFRCPACKHDHVFSNRWQFNGNMDRPSFTPSLLVWHDGDPGNGIKPFRCHLYLTDGQLQFLNDCTHELKGKTVPLQDIPGEVEWLTPEG